MQLYCLTADLYLCLSPSLKISLTSTVLLVVVTAVSHVQTPVVTVAGLGVEVEDDAVGVGVGGAHLTVGVLSLTAFPGRPAAPEESSR